MTDDRIMALLSAAADGDLDAEEQAELDGLMQSSPDARQFADELQRIDEFLHAADELDVPDSLHEKIVNGIEVSEAPTVVALHRPAIPAVFRYGLATAAGLLLAVGFYESRSLPPGSQDFSELVGTMAPDRDVARTRILDTYDFRADGFASLAQLERRDGEVFLDIRIEAARPLDISLDIAPAGIWPGALAQLEDGFESITMADSSLRLRATGRRRLTVLLSNAASGEAADAAKVEIEFTSEGRLLGRGLLQATE
jgi:hypothetical protein